MAPRPHILTIGNFDGVHLGHVELLARALAIADASTERGIVTALVLDPHPHAVLKPEEPAPDRITTFEQRRDLLLACGADEVERLTPTPELLGREPEAFIEGLVEAYAPTWFVEGHDFRFGKARRGDEFLLRELGERLGFGLTVVDEHLVALENQSLVRASSSIARWLIAHGRMSDAAHVLGRPYRIEGIIERGDRRGREIGFPTANVRTDNAFPADGVYAATATLDDGRRFRVALHVGERPVFNDTKRTVEAYILDWVGPIEEGREEYGWRIRLDLHAYIRDQMRFSSVEPLVEQIHRDVARTREILSNVSVSTQPQETIA